MPETIQQPSNLPTLRFDEAETVGHKLHDRFVKMSGSAPMEREDMGWGDVVQFVLREARSAAAARELVEDDEMGAAIDG